MKKKLDEKIKKAMLKAYDKTVGPIEDSFEKTVLKLLNEQTKRISKAYLIYTKEKKSMTDKGAETEARKILEKFYSFDDDIDIFMKEFVKYYLLSGKAGNEYFNFIHFTKPEDGTLFSIIRDDYLEWLQAYGGNEIKRINETTKETIKAVIEEGLKSGDGNAKIAVAITEKLDNISPGRARAIAQTETHNSFMHANMMSATASGFKKKRWVSMRDESVRPNHQKYDQMGEIPIEQEFAPGLMYPGDSNAPASEVVRCRCVVRYMD